MASVNMSLKIVIRRQYVNAGSGVLCKQKFQLPFVLSLVCQDFGYQRRQFVSIHIQMLRS